MIASLLLAMGGLQTAEVEPTPAADWHGCWSDGTVTYFFEPGRAGRWGEERADFYRIEPVGDFLRANTGAQVAWWQVERKGEALVFEDGASSLQLTRVEEVPAELLVLPYETAEWGELSPETIERIRSELAELTELDQDVRRRAQAGSFSEQLVAEMTEIDARCTRYLLDLLPEIGWADETRFGPEAAMNAFLLVQHSADLRLQATALPILKEEVRPGRRTGQSFALLYDRFQLRLGYRQRYGSQLADTADGVLVILPLEDRERLDELRAALGMQPIADYLAYFPEPDEIRYLDDVLLELEPPDSLAR